MLSTIEKISLTVCVFIMILIAGCSPEAAPAPTPPMPPTQSTATAQPTSQQPTLAMVTPTAQTCPAGTHIVDFKTGSQTRQYRLHGPSHPNGAPMALVLLFHGNGGSADGMEGWTGFSDLADQKGFVVVYPMGIGVKPSWDIGHSSANPDLLYVQDMIVDIEARCEIDRNQVFATGFSAGGGMVNRLGCNFSDRIAAIAPVSGVYQDSENCNPVRPVPVFAVHGTKDPEVPYNGLGDLSSPPQAYFNIQIPVPQWAGIWAQRNGCADKSRIIEKNDRYSVEIWEACREGAEVILNTMAGGGHTWPGGTGAPAGDFHTTQAIWDFFARHPLKGK